MTLDRVPSLCHCSPATNHSPTSHSAPSQLCCGLGATLLTATPYSQCLEALRGPWHLHTSGAPSPYSMHSELVVRPPALPHCLPQRSPSGSPPAHTLAWALEGEEEQVELQGHERGQHRLKLPLEALGQGQDEQEL